MSNKHLVKVLVSGDVNGQVSSLLQRVETVNSAHGPFHSLFLAGNLADAQSESKEIQDLLSGTRAVSLPIYATSTAHEAVSPEASIHFLGSQGLYTTIEGVRVAYFDGKDQDISIFEKAALKDDFKGVDILLTAEWPADVLLKTTHSLPTDNIRFSDTVRQLVLLLYPRYHFTLHSTAFERAPYKHLASRRRDMPTFCKFIALSAVKNPDKQKWLYAMNLIPWQHLVRLNDSAYREARDLPENTTESPFATVSEPSKQQQQQQQSSHAASSPIDATRWQTPADSVSSRSQQQQQQHAPPPPHYICHKCNESGHWIQQCPLRTQPNSGANKTYICRICGETGHYIQDCRLAVKRRKVITSHECWFCLSNPAVEKHLLVSVGDESYLALAKGPLVAHHLLIIPIAHLGHAVALPSAVRAEMKKYMDNIAQFYENCLQKRAVFFETNVHSQHCIVHAVPIDASYDTSQLEQHFRQMVGQQHDQIDIVSASDATLLDPPSPTTDREHLHSFGLQWNRAVLRALLPDGVPFPVSFGRDLLAEHVLQMPERAHWKACLVSAEEELEAATALKKQFAPFDFTLND